MSGACTVSEWGFRRSGRVLVLWHCWHCQVAVPLTESACTSRCDTRLDQSRWSVCVCDVRAVCPGFSRSLPMSSELLLLYSKLFELPELDRVAATDAQLSLFLSTLLDDPAGFTVVRLPRSAMGEWAAAAGGRARWVGWVAWCPSSLAPGTSGASSVPPRAAPASAMSSGLSGASAEGVAAVPGSSNASQEAQEASGSPRSAVAAGGAASGV